MPMKKNISTTTDIKENRNDTPDFLTAVGHLIRPNFNKYTKAK